MASITSEKETTPRIRMWKYRIRGGNPLRGIVHVDGSKNASLPLLAASLLANSPSKLHGVPRLKDVETLCSILRYMGAKVRRRGDTLTIDPRTFDRPEAPYDIVRQMRASFYVLGPTLARFTKARVSLPGGCVFGPRPVDLHIKGMEHLNAQCTLDRGYIIAHTKRLQGSTFSLMGKQGTSVGATCNVLMAAALAHGTTIIQDAAREPEVLELVNFLTRMGARIIGSGTNTLTIEGVKELHGIDYTVVPDRIEAGTWMVAAAITRGKLTIKRFPLQHLKAVIEKLRAIGVTVEHDDRQALVHAKNKLRPTNIVTQTYPGFPTDLQPVFSTLLCLVPGESMVTDTIYPKRFVQIGELQRMGANVHEHLGTAVINGVKQLYGAPIMASDIRGGAALTLAALAAKGETVLDRIYHIDRGYYHLERKLAALGADIKRFR